MFSKYLLMSFFAFAGGVMVSGGVFTVLIAVGLIPRFADKSHTSNRIFLYEEMVVLGTITGSFLSVYPDYGQIGICRNVCGMSCTGDCRNDRYHSDFYQAYQF